MHPLLLTALVAAADPIQVHANALVIDAHADTPQRFLDEGYDLATPAGTGHVDLDKIRAGNLGAEFFALWVEPVAHRGRFVHRTLALIDAVLEQVARHPEALTLALTADDIVAARRGPAPRLAVLMGIEGGHVIENDLRLLRVFHRLGVRYMTLTWANTNEWADSSGDAENTAVTRHGGLTRFGEAVVAEMNRLGMMVDVSHVSDETFFDVLRVTRAPIIASHSSVRAICNHPRNLSDPMLAAIAKNGGVAQVNFFSAFLDEGFKDAWLKAEARRKAAKAELQPRSRSDGDGLWQAELERSRAEVAKLPRPPLARLIEHIDHVVKVAGIDHVGLGSDFDGISSAPAGLDSVADLPKITAALLARGYTAEQVTKVLGGNLLRVMRAVEDTAKRAGGDRPVSPRR